MTKKNLRKSGNNYRETKVPLSHSEITLSNPFRQPVSWLKPKQVLTANIDVFLEFANAEAGITRSTR